MAGMICRYDAEHGSFSTAFLLGRHYAEAHADVYEKPKQSTVRYTCRLCGDGRSFLNAGSHLQQVHPVEYAQGKPFVSKWFDKVDESVEQSRPANGVDVIDDLHAIEERNRSRSPRHVGPWDVDDIVLPVVEQLAAPKGLVPVAHLAAILAWRDATSVMLAAVTGR